MCLDFGDKHSVGPGLSVWPMGGCGLWGWVREQVWGWGVRGVGKGASVGMGRGGGPPRVGRGVSVGMGHGAWGWNEIGTPEVTLGRAL